MHLKTQLNLRTQLLKQVVENFLEVKVEVVKKHQLKLPLRKHQQKNNQLEETNGCIRFIF
jgi:hypothetical protein